VLTRLLPFVALIAVLVAIPGPAVVLIMKNAVLHGRRAALLTGCGVYFGDLLWVGASATGLTAVLVASRPAFETLRYLGAAYLIYLGARLVFARSRASDAIRAENTELKSSRSARRAFVQGTLCELSNPKTLLVFTSVIPQFVPPSAGAVNLAFYGVLFATLGFCSLVMYAIVLSMTGRVVKRPKLTERITRASGGVLVAFGVGLAVQHSD
jgi:threonine/homoserine/homoserine lactone efflux protein